MKAPLRILAVALVCALALIGLVVREGMARASGAEVILRVEAFDPRDVLSGHYVSLQFREAFPQDQTCPPGTQDPNIWTANDVKWIALRANGDHHSVAGAAKDRREAERIAPLVVKGRISCVLPHRGPIIRSAIRFGEPPPSPSVTIGFGFRGFHVNQAEAERIERILRAQRPGQEARVSAIVSVGRDGRARLKGLIVDGQRIELRWI